MHDSSEVWGEGVGGEVDMIDVSPWEDERKGLLRIKGDTVGGYQGGVVGNDD